MARQKDPVSLNFASVTNVKQALSSVSLIVQSFIIQNPITSTDYVVIGDTSNQLFQIAPGKDFEYEGEKLDNGTQSYTDLSAWFIKSVSGTQTANLIYIQGF